MRQLLWAALAATAIASPYASSGRRAVTFTIETAPGESLQVTEAEKDALKDQGVDFVDITEWPGTGRASAGRTVAYPTDLAQKATVEELNAALDTANMRKNLHMFTSFNNRYYQSKTGNLSAEWLLGQVGSYVEVDSPVTLSVFQHVYQQSSIIATIPGKSAKTIVVGAHLDSINGQAGVNRTTARAPGADDDGSGSMTILEAFRTLLLNDTITSGQAEQTIEFHWYAAEEAGLLGSGNVFRSYAEEGRDIAAMLNQDMTGYTAGYTSKNMTPKFGIITDYTDPALTNFTRRVIEAYTDTETGDSVCGYGCSDHVSATRAGYPSAFVFEGEMRTVNDNPYVHTANDTIEKLDFAHMLEHARMVVGFVVELAFAKL
ncbi:peptide hydrolase [Parastagonospora nodorum]|nr:peptide hydrolase [Parastagonospora nodorum]KAH3988588.1 peptide hydrolase [Parastagonospora nodorum]KAH4067023.1 peptide hydrolase [Parastagonospora nodorum]KAH4085323.1 peptide hydrolase [Parastagonospora nodorum]KAH4108105.1 peptide hydrolase [Parastagonospora nodorum]